MEQNILFALPITLVNAASASVSASDNIHGISHTLLYELNALLDTETEFGRRDSQPHIKMVENERAEMLRCVADRSGGSPRGPYDEVTDTIYLTKPWAASNRRDLSVLLHEMVHHRQSEQHWYCQHAQEWRAYQTQAQWLGEQNI